MQTVNFTCGHCGKLMAVEQHLLGQQVRCPHCQQVVEAPAATPPAPPVPAESGPAPYVVAPFRDEESIFTPKEVHDDIFGDGKPPATLEMPPDATCPETAGTSPAPCHESPAASPEWTAPAPPFGAEPEPTPFSATPADQADRTAVLSSPLVWTDDGEGPAEPETNVPIKAGLERGGSRRFTEKGLTAAAVLIFLVPYSIFMTGVAVYFYYQTRQNINPLEMLPDVPAEHPGVTRKGQQASNVMYQRWKVETPLPARLRVPLGGSIQVGALEVSPERVERSKVVFCYDPPLYAPQTSGTEALVLTLRLKNVSSDQTFYPTDRAFDAYWKKDRSQPYTFLEVGSSKFFGGPIVWPPEKKVREFVKGQDRDNQPLYPNEQRTTLVCTDPGDRSVLSALQSYKGPLLWRVRLRRGLVQVRDKEISASAVIGVEFAANDIQKGIP
jgi:hypothetical protein